MRTPADYTRFEVLRIVLLIAVALTLALAACNGGGGTSSNGPSATDNGPALPPVTAVARPAAVPATAEVVPSDTTLGQIVRRANAAPETEDIRRLVTAACQEDVMVLRTSKETIYADLPCNNFGNDEATRSFVGEEIAVTLTIDNVRFQIFIETLPGAQAEFTVGGVWLD